MASNVRKGRKGFQQLPLSERFWAKVDKRGEDECWPWAGAHDGRGRGQIWVNGRNVRAPRVAWQLANNVVLPPDLDACHSCDNPNCVNPNHIWPGTARENALDAVSKARVKPSLMCRRSANREATRCLRGHLLSGDNLLNKANGRRACKECAKLHRSRYEARAALGEKDGIDG